VVDTEAVSADEAELAAGASVSWAHLLRRHAHLLPDKPAIRFEGRTLTFAELDRRIDRLAAALAARGVGAGDRVAILSGNRPEILETVGATARLGAIAVPINFRLVGPEVAFLLADSGAAAVVTDADRLAVANAAQGELERPVATLVVGPGARGGVEEDYEAALEAAEPGSLRPTAATLQAWKAESPALIMYTSGTTGRPKGAVLTHLNLFVQTFTQVRTARLVTDRDVTLCASPIFHIAGIGSTVPSLLLGNTLVLVGSVAFDPAAIADLMEQEGVTSMFLVPTQWQAMCNLPGMRDRKLRLRTMAWGASPAPPSTLQAMAETFPEAENVAVFGQTEMSPVTAALEGERALDKLGSVGRPVATVDIRIVDEEMRDVRRGEIGEIVYRGPTTMAGYWRNPEATAEAMRGGWFHSGDLVQEDDEGYLRVVDRTKDMIISGGENIYSSEVEAAIDGHPKVREVAVVAGPHERWVETPVAIITATDPADPPEEAELLDWLAGRIASYKKPSQVRVVDALPMNATGKVRKNDLRRWVAEGGDFPG
jgi:fatty-acyl-CoA synthase